MEKETLLAGFNERLGNPDANGMYANAGVSTRTVDVYIDNLLPTITDDAQVDDAFWQRHTDFLKTMGGQLRHEKAEFVRTYKPAVNEPPKPTETPEMEELKKRLETIEKEHESEKLQLTVKGLRMDAKGKADALKVNNKALWNDAVDMVEFEEGMDSEKMTKTAKTIYEKKLKEYFGEGCTPYGGAGNGGATVVNDDEAKARREAFKKRMQSQGRLPKDEN